MKAKSFLAIGLPALLLACGNAAPASTTQLTKPTFDVGNSSDFIPGQILVDLKDDVSDNDVKEIESKFGVSFSEANSVAHEYRYEEATVNVANEETVLEALSGDARVEHAEPVVKYHALFTPNDPMYSEQYGLTRIGIENAWNMSCGIGVKVASLDTGVACMGEHRLNDLAECESGYNTADSNEDAFDRHGHGSHTVGSIAQLTNNGIGGAGVAPCVHIMPVKVLSDSGSGTNEGIAEGIRYAVDHGAQVINMSLGGPRSSEVLKDACQYAHDKGVVVVAAAGNSGPSNNSVGYPAAFPSVIAVSAIGPDDKIAEFSSRGPEVDIAAPGVDILQQTVCNKPEGCFLKFSGTSMASPINAGVAALIMSNGITDPDAVKAKLQSTADPKDGKNEYGAGIVNANAAVKSTILNHAFLRLLALIGVILFLGKTIKGQWKNRYSLAGIVATGFGAVPLFFLGLLPKMGSLRIVGEVLARPFGEWDVALGHGHSLLLLASAIPTAIASVLMLNHPKAKLFAAGLGIGTMALEGQIAYSNDTRFIFGSIAMRIFMVINMMVCAFFIKSIFETKKA